MAFKYRCTHRACRKRHSFAQPLEAYTRTPRGVTRLGLCARCGVGHLHSSDREVARTNARAEVCNCGLIPYPHRLGSSDRNHAACAADVDADWERWWPSRD